MYEPETWHATLYGWVLKQPIFLGMCCLLPIPALMKTPNSIPEWKTFEYYWQSYPDARPSKGHPQKGRETSFDTIYIISHWLCWAHFLQGFTWIIDVRHHFFIQIGIPWSIYPMLSPCLECRSTPSLKQNLCDQLIFICIYIQQQWIIRICARLVKSWDK